MEPEAMKNLQLDKICRCCLTVKKEMRPLFGELIADMLTECAQVQVEKTDGWPDKVCMQCVQQISRFHSFKKKVELLDQQLREYIKGLTVIVEEQVSPELSLGKIELSGQQFLATTANGHHQVLQGGPTLLATTAYGQSVQIQSNGQVIPVHMLPGQRHVMQIKPPVSDESYEIIVPSESATGTAIIHDNSPYYEDDIDDPKVTTVIEEILEEVEQGDLDEGELEEEEEDEEMLEEEEIDCGEDVDQDYIVEEIADSETEDMDQSHQSQSEDLESLLDTDSMPQELNQTTTTTTLIQTKCSNHVQIPISWSDSEDDPEQKEFMAEFISLQTSCPEPGRHICNLCHKEFKHSKWLHTHMKSHSNWFKANCKRQPECEICHKKFRGPGMLKMHMKTHAERSLRCQLCLKTFQNEYHLGLHMMKHKKLSSNPFRCEPCNMSFISANEMKIHKRINHKSTEPGISAVTSPNSSTVKISWQRNSPGSQKQKESVSKEDPKKILRVLSNRQKVRS